MRLWLLGESYIITPEGNYAFEDEMFRDIILLNDITNSYLTYFVVKQRDRVPKKERHSGTPATTCYASDIVGT